MLGLQLSPSAGSGAGAVRDPRGMRRTWTEWRPLVEHDPIPRFAAPVGLFAPRLARSECDVFTTLSPMSMLMPVQLRGFDSELAAAPGCCPRSGYRVDAVGLNTMPSLRPTELRHTLVRSELPPEMRNQACLLPSRGLPSWNARCTGEDDEV